jgi:hypothetical protein
MRLPSWRQQLASVGKALLWFGFFLILSAVAQKRLFSLPCRSCGSKLTVVISRIVEGSSEADHSVEEREHLFCIQCLRLYLLEDTPTRRDRAMGVA